MRVRIVWADPVRDVFLDLPEADQAAIQAKLDLVEVFPNMYVMQARGRFRRHRKFVAGNWAVYYRVVERSVYIRAIWPARISLTVLGRR